LCRAGSPPAVLCCHSPEALPGRLLCASDSRKGVRPPDPLPATDPALAPRLSGTARESLLPRRSPAEAAPGVTATAGCGDAQPDAQGGRRQEHRQPAGASSRTSLPAVATIGPATDHPGL